MFLFYNFFFSKFIAEPKFSEQILNVTVPVGREAQLTCVVEDLGSYKVNIKRKLKISWVYNLKIIFLSIKNCNFFYFK